MIKMELNKQLDSTMELGNSRDQAIKNKLWYYKHNINGNPVFMNERFIKKNIKQQR